MWWIVVTLLVLGVLLMLVEMLLIPGVGVAGFLSLGSLGVACWYAFSAISTAAGWWTSLAAVLLLGVMMFFALRAKTWRRFELKTEVTSKMGTESVGGFRGITISNCVFDRCRGLALECVDGGTVEDITVSNIVMRDICTAPLFLRLGHRGRGPEGRGPGVLRRIKLSHIIVDGADARYASPFVGMSATC